jgi:outer membrane protein assembly factor BamB
MIASSFFRIFQKATVAVGCAVVSACSTSQPTPTGPGTGGVLQYHNNASRDGHYVDAAFTKAAAAQLHMDKSFQAAIEGPTHAQPLYFDAGSGGRDLVLTTTEQNLVYALDAANGSVVWQKKLGDPVILSALPCGNLDPLGITGTPIIDLASKRLFVAAMTTPDGGATKRHKVFALSLDDGSVIDGWPLEVSAVVKSGTTSFDSSIQNQRGALALLNGVLYVPYGAHGGDCGVYHGWVLGIPIDKPSGVEAFATKAACGGIWAVGGLASDGTSIFAATGNTRATDVWAHGEAILRLRPAVAGVPMRFTEAPMDYFAPSDWLALDGGDVDLGGTGPILVDVPGATPEHLVLAHGKNGVVYVLDRDNLGGIGKGDGKTGEGLVSAKVSTIGIITGPVTYRTDQGTYVVAHGGGIGCPAAPGDITAIKLSPTAPPKISVAWCAYESSNASPMVTTTDGHSEAILWGIGAGSSNKLLGFDGDNGQVIFAGGGPEDTMANIQQLTTAIVAKGRIFVATDTGVYAFTTR